MFIFPLNLLLPQLISNFLIPETRLVLDHFVLVSFLAAFLFFLSTIFSPFNELLKSLAASFRIPGNFAMNSDLKNFREKLGLNDFFYAFGK